MFETTLSIEPKAIALADKAIATVRIVGTEPLRLAVPAAILDETTSLNWNISTLGPATESREGASFVWQQQYQLSPFIVGNSLPVQFNSFTVNDSAVVVPSAQVSVTTSIHSLTTADVRPVTPLELSPSTTLGSSPTIMVLGALVGLGLLLCVAGILLWLRRKTVNEVPSQMDRLRADLASWVASDDMASAVELAHRIRAVFPEPTSEDQMERFARLDRWMYSAEVTTLEETQSEIEYWRERVAEQVRPLEAAPQVKVP